MKKNAPASTDTAVENSWEIKGKKKAAKSTSHILDRVSLPQNAVCVSENILTAALRGFAASGEPLVDYPEDETGKGVKAKTVVSLSDADIGRDVCVMFDRGNKARPVILGVIRDPHENIREDNPPLFGPSIKKIDADRLIFDAGDDVIIQCGKSSITLYKDGRIVIRGEKILSRASRENKIKGGSVSIN